MGLVSSILRQPVFRVDGAAHTEVAVVDAVATRPEVRNAAVDHVGAGDADQRGHGHILAGGFLQAVKDEIALAGSY